MFSWVGGLKTATGEAQHDSTFVEAPETPAPVFALRAFKHAIYGTPQPEAGPSTLRKKGSDTVLRRSQEQLRWHPPSIDQRPSSPSKPNGILMTPGTINGRRKQVTFGSQVKDDEASPPIVERINKSSDNLPTSLLSNMKEDEKLEKLRKKTKHQRGERKNSEKQAKQGYEVPIQALELLGATPYKEHGRKHSNAGQDDDAHTVDFDDPQSESGRYWKEAFESYSERSEAETKVLIAKARLAKDFAKKKDDEVMELRLALETERRKNNSERQRRDWLEESLQREILDLRKRLGVQLGENTTHVDGSEALRRTAQGDVAFEFGQELKHHERQTSHSGSIKSDAAKHVQVSSGLVVQDEVQASNGLSIWAAAGETAESRRSVETLKPAAPTHIFAQMSGSSGSPRTKRRSTKLTTDPSSRSSTSGREMGDGLSRSSRSSTGSSSMATTDSAGSLQVPGQASNYSAFATTPLSPIHDLPEPGTDSVPVQPRIKRERPLSIGKIRHTPRASVDESSPTLPLKFYVPDLAVQRGGDSPDGSIKSKVHRVDSKRSSNPSELLRDDSDTDAPLDISNTPLAVLRATAVASQSIVSLAELERQKQKNVASSSSSKPSRPGSVVRSDRSAPSSTSTSSTAGALAPLDRSGRAPSSNSSGALPHPERERQGRPKAGSRKKTSGAIIDAERVAAARARIAARKALNAQT